ncbi:spermidine synthase [Paenibacillus septentrionalis]|uniref:Spermidine synthase n=1 Tax=Paenibacillus septentrionalis TaxID=429342 RepID=A0ABW1V620_9BACL
MKVLASYGSGQEQILVYETTALFDEKGSFRLLQFADEAVQGAIDLQRPERIVFEYPRALIHVIEHNRRQASVELFIIGHGIGTISRYFNSQSCVTAEIDETVVQLSQEYFGWSGEHVMIGDGRLLLEQEQRQYDYIVLDAFTSKGVPQHLSTVQFFALAHSKLKRHGALLINVTGKGKQDVRSNAMFSTLQHIFPHTSAFTLQSAQQRDIRNSIFIGSNDMLQYRLKSMAGLVPYIPEPGYLLYD